MTPQALKFRTDQASDLKKLDRLNTSMLKLMTAKKHDADGAPLPLLPLKIVL
jgi:hypothetical protein